MKAVILAGGRGTRLSEETVTRPKPMVKIGPKPILWHIMKIYSQHGIHDFIVCCGYKGYMIKEYFANYLLHSSDVTIDIARNNLEIHENTAEPWRVTLVDTGEKSGTGGRLRRVRGYLDDGEDFCFTYGDGVSNIDIGQLIDFHRQHGKLVTMTSIRPPSKYGVLAFRGNDIVGFQEKPPASDDDSGGWINGGFFVVSPRAIDYIENDEMHWEVEPLQRLVREKQLVAYRHSGFWQSMDTLRDKTMLEQMWASGDPPWKVWS